MKYTSFIFFQFQEATRISANKPFPTKQVNPFVDSKAECPVCSTKVINKRIKPRLYAEQDPDVDLRPRKVTWLEKGLEDYIPRFYYIWFCPKCRFAAGDSFFESPVKNTELRPMVFTKKMKTILDKDPYVKKLVGYLSKDIIPSEPNPFQSVKLHLLAIFLIQQLEEMEKRDTLNLGRYCLRLAWVYRDITESPELSHKYIQQINKFIGPLKKAWPSVPVNEKKALLLAVKYYQTALVKSRMIKTTREGVTLLLLIARIHLKLDNVPEAHKYLTLAMDQERNHERKRKDLISLAKIEESDRLKDDKISFSKKDPGAEAAVKIKEMGAEGRRMKLMITEFQIIFDDIREEWELDQIRKARAILEKSTAKKDDDLRQILTDNGFSQKIVFRVVPNIRKKGLFGFLKRKKR